jgi:RNA polymerase sigma-70 factor, ECF subfamily
MFRLALRVLGDPDRAQDVVQEAFLRVHRAAAKYRPQARLTTWLYRIVVNLCLDEMRRGRRAPGELAYDPPQGPPPDPLDQRERIELIRNAVAGLPERQRIAVTLCRYHGLSHREIAETTGWTTSAVESLLVRAYQSLRRDLAHLEEK